MKYKKKSIYFFQSDGQAITIRGTGFWLKVQYFFAAGSWHGQSGQSEGQVFDWKTNFFAAGSWHGYSHPVLFLRNRHVVTAPKSTDGSEDHRERITGTVLVIHGFYLAISPRVKHQRITGTVLVIHSWHRSHWVIPLLGFGVPLLPLLRLVSAIWPPTLSLAFVKSVMDSWQP